MDAKEAERKFKLAEKMYDEGRYGQALVVLDALAAAFPNEKNIMFPRARTLAKLERVEEALVICDQLIAQFNDPKAATLKKRLGGQTDGLPPEMPPIPDIGEFSPQPVRPPVVAAQPFYRTVPFLVGACAVLAVCVLAAGVLALRTGQEPSETASEVGESAQSPSAEAPREGPPPSQTAVAEDTEPDEFEEELTSAFYALGWRLAAGIVILAAEVVAALYLTLLMVGKLPHGTLGADLLSVAPVATGAWLAGVVSSVVVFICPVFACLGTFIPIFVICLILNKVYDMGFVDLIVYFCFVGGFGVVNYFAVFPALAPSVDLGDLISRELTREEEPAPGSSDSGAPATIPEASITVDGQTADWASVPVYLTVEKTEFEDTTYDVQRIKLAHDYVNVYVLLELGVGIEEKFWADYQETGRVSSGAIGYLALGTPETDYSIWLPTGFTQTTDPKTGAAQMYPVIDAEVTGKDPATGVRTTLATLQSTTNPDALYFGQRAVEMKFSMDALGFSTEWPVTATLDEF